MQYLGHSSFLWIGPSGTRVIVDPYDNTHPSGWQWFLRSFPDVEADIVLITHDHFDHNATHRVRRDPRVVRTSGHLSADDLTIDGYEDKHASPDDIPNTIFVLDADGVRICHLGDNRA